MDVIASPEQKLLRPESSFLLGCGLLAVVLLAMPQHAVPKSRPKPKPPVVDTVQMRDQRLVNGADEQANRPHSKSRTR